MTRQALCLSSASWIFSCTWGRKKTSCCYNVGSLSKICLHELSWPPLPPVSSQGGIKVFVLKYVNHLRLYSKSDMQVMACSALLAYLLQQIMSESLREQEPDPVCGGNAPIWEVICFYRKKPLKLISKSCSVALWTRVSLWMSCHWKPTVHSSECRSWTYSDCDMNF